MSKLKRCVLALTAAASCMSALEPAEAVTLQHRYSFTSNANDSVGTAHLNLQGAATVTGGALDTSNANAGARNDGAFAAGAALTQLAATINSSPTITMEAWFNQDQFNNWSKVMMTGLDTGQYMDITPRRGDNFSVSSSINDNAHGENNVQAGAFGALTNDVPYYVAATWNAPANQMKLSVGQVGGSLSHFTATMGGQQPSAVAINQFYLGSAVGFGDPDFDGQIDEFRVWSGALTNGQIAANFAAGPNTVANSGDLVGLYRFENAGTIGLDSSGRGNNLVANGNAAQGAGGTLQLDGSGDFLSGSPVGLSIGDDSYAISAQIKPSAAGQGANNGVVGWGQYGAGNTVTAIRTAPDVFAGNGDSFRHYWWGNDQDALAGIDLHNGAFHHLVAQYDANTGVRSIYIDGVLIASQVVPDHAAIGSNFAIGVTNFNEFFNGMLDDVAIFGRALTLEEIQAVGRGNFTAFLAPVPEPATAMLGLLGAGLLGLRRRRAA